MYVQRGIIRITTDAVKEDNRRVILPWTGLFARPDEIDIVEHIYYSFNYIIVLIDSILHSISSMSDY